MRTAKSASTILIEPPWINDLKDRAVRARDQVRIDRLVHGNPGQYRMLTNGVVELKIDVGPGYRIYYMERGDELIVLLAGGNKATQQQNIKTAIELARSQAFRSSAHAKDR